MLATVTHILPLTTIVRNRTLPIAGRVLVRLNQKVVATEVVAEAELSREHFLIDVARSLGLTPEAADRLIRCKMGESLAQGTVIAEGGGLFRRTVQVSREGRVVAMGGGQVLLDVGETVLQLRAGIPGQVVEVIENRGVVLQTTGALIQGVWGNGRMDTGVLLSLVEKPGDVLESSRFDVSLRGSVILAGHCQDADTLRAAAELPVRGLILASLMPSLLPLASQMHYPIVVVDGFGNLPMNQTAYKILSTNVKREVALNADVYNRYAGVRPEIIIPLPVNQELPALRDVETFAPGQQVRLRRAPNAGEIATLANLRPGLSSLPSGLRAQSAEIRLQNGQLLLVPLVNLEVVG